MSVIFVVRTIEIELSGGMQAVLGSSREIIRYLRDAVYEKEIGLCIYMFISGIEWRTTPRDALKTWQTCSSAM